MNKNLTKINSRSDSNYKAPLGILEMRIIGWIFIILSNASTLLLLFSNVFDIKFLSLLSIGFASLSGLSMPCFLLANFGYIIQSKDKYKKVMFNYLLIALLFILGYFVVYILYKINVFDKLITINIEDIINRVLSGDLTFNIFIDLFLCSLFIYFIMAKPKNKSKERKYKFCSILPLIYEIIFIVINLLHHLDIIIIPFFLIPFMPTKAPITFIAFILIVIGEYKRKKKYYKEGGNMEGYNEFISTNTNSIMFSKSASKIFLFCGLFDLLLLLILIIFGSIYSSNDVIINVLSAGRLEEGLSLVIFSPIALLFRYNKIYEMKKKDLLIPICSVLIIILMYLESVYQIFTNLLRK